MHDAPIHEQPMLRERPPQQRAEIPAPASVKRPSGWSPSNWPVRLKVLAIVIIPALLAVGFGGLRVYENVTVARNLYLGAYRAAMVKPF
jgi:hypothetical protein